MRADGVGGDLLPRLSSTFLISTHEFFLVEIVASFVENGGGGP